MKSAVIAIFLIFNIACSNAVFLKKPNQATFAVFSQLQEIEEEEFGKKIMDTIALQMKNKSPLVDIANMLKEIRTDLVTQLAAANQLHQQQEAECDTEIKEYNRRIDVASATITTTEAEIATLKAEIAQLEGEIRNKKIQLEILDKREIDLKESRVRDAEDFVKRQANAVEVGSALELIIEKFSTINSEGKPEVALAELAKIGSTNPILALVEVASTFSEESLKKVKAKLEELRASLAQSAEEDKQNEQAAVGEYEALLHELEETRKSVSQALDDANIKLKQVQAALGLQEKIHEEAVNELKSAQTGKADKEKQCEDWRNKWAADKEAKQKDIDTVKKIEALIATKVDSIKDYIKEKVGLSQTSL